MNKRRRRPSPSSPSRRAAATETLVFALLGTAGSVEARLEAALSPVGLSLAKVGVLHCLVDAGEPLPLSELAQHEKCVRSNITQLIDRLEKDGLVRRRADPNDRRSIRAALTPAGQRAYAQAMRALAQEQRAILRLLSSADATRLQSALQALAS